MIARCIQCRVNWDMDFDPPGCPEGGDDHTWFFPESLNPDIIVSDPRGVTIRNVSAGGDIIARSGPDA